MNLTSATVERRSEKETIRRKLYTEFYGYTLKIAFRYLLDYESATVATNATFADIFQNTNHRKLKSEGKLFKSFITKRTVMNVLKLYDCTVKEAKLEADQMMLEALSPVNLDARLVSYLGRLSPWNRALFNMHVIDGFTLAEIAEHFRCTQSFCASQLAQTRNHLGDLMKNKKEAGLQ